MSKPALILMARSPIPAKSKTRLLPVLSPEQTVELQYAFLEDLARILSKMDLATILYYLPSEDDSRLKSLFPFAHSFLEQKPADLGERMHYGLSHCLDMGFEKACLIGSDLPEMRADLLIEAFRFLDYKDAVLGPAKDGGYYLVGLKKAYSPLFQDKEYSHSHVFEEALESLNEGNLATHILPALDDIDTPEDLVRLYKRIKGNNSSTARILEEYDEFIKRSPRKSKSTRLSG